MKKFVVISGGFHPFHAGHADLYQQAKEAFPDSTVLVCATNVQTDRPFPFELKQKLAQLSGVPKNDFIEVSRQFSVEDPGLSQRIGDTNNAIVIFVRSGKDRNEQPQGLPLNPNKDEIPLVTRGPNKGKPIKLLDYNVNKDDLMSASKHTYIAYLKTVEFGPGIKSASEIRELWPKLNDKRKLIMVMSLYPHTKNNIELAQKVVDMFNEVMSSLNESKVIPVTPVANTPFTKQEKKQIVRVPEDKKQPQNPDFIVNIQNLENRLEEAKNLAQQAAIAINMKKLGKKPKANESVDYLDEK
jgi:cytidyltransferase-like protein